ncbi:MAG TPA: DUF4834 family protein [Candidatus Avimuribaculum pullicola]|nr:DUF4834 family protein [Candidatus Avimuribaculum pullicola]
MGLFLLILLLLLFLLLYPVIKAGFKVWMQMRQMNKAFQNAQSQYGGGTRGEQRRTSSTGNNEYKRHRRHGGKIFRPGDGEYVKFEEIIEQRQSVQYVEVADAEPRITDVRYEDI